MKTIWKECHNKHKQFDILKSMERFYQDSIDF